MKVLDKDDMVVITMPMSSISGRKKFEVQRKWLRDYLGENFDLIDEFIIGNTASLHSLHENLRAGERVFRVRVK